MKTGNLLSTQMIHLQHVGNTITHLDHEYIFYDLENYDERIYNVGVKGEGRKRVKTFKIDRSTYTNGLSMQNVQR